MCVLSSTSNLSQIPGDPLLRLFLTASRHGDTCFKDIQLTFVWTKHRMRCRLNEMNVSFVFLHKMKNNENARKCKFPASFYLSARELREIPTRKTWKGKGWKYEAGRKEERFSDASYWLQSISGFILCVLPSLFRYSAYDEIQSSAGCSAAAFLP